jgi:transposase
LVFLDESGANLAMGRSHAWVLRGEEYVEPRPMNWGDNLSLIGAVRLGGWVTLGTQWKAVKAKDFTAWVRDRLAPRLQPGDIVFLDNLRPHKAPAVAALIARRGATVKFLPPYSHDFNPIEAVWALVKKYIRTFAPRTPLATSWTPITARGSSPMPGTSHQVREGIRSSAVEEETEPAGGRDLESLDPSCPHLSVANAGARRPAAGGVARARVAEMVCSRHAVNPGALDVRSRTSAAAAFIAGRESALDPRAAVAAVSESRQRATRPVAAELVTREGFHRFDGPVAQPVARSGSPHRRRRLVRRLGEYRSVHRQAGCCRGCRNKDSESYGRGFSDGSPPDQ